MVSTRLTELWMPDVAPSLKQLTEAQESGSALFPVDFMTDCRDFFELTTGAKAVPQDKQQRLYVLAYKEARVSGRARYVMLIPTASMLADCLTKPMLAPQMMQFLSSGFVEVWNELKHFIQLRRLPVLQELTEADLYKSDEEIKKQIHNGAQKVTMTMVAGFATKPWKWMMMAAMVSGVNGQPDQEKVQDNLQDWIFFGIIFCSYVFLRAVEVHQVAESALREAKGIPQEEARTGHTKEKEQHQLRELRARARTLSPAAES